MGGRPERTTARFSARRGPAGRGLGGNHFLARACFSLIRLRSRLFSPRLARNELDIIQIRASSL